MHHQGSRRSGRAVVWPGALAAALLLALGCAAPGASTTPRTRPFRFPADTFAFSNETVWEYRLDSGTGAVSWYRRDPRPAFVLRCGTMARAARQFLDGARFDASAPAVDPSTYERLVREVLRSDPRHAPDIPVLTLM